MNRILAMAAFISLVTSSALAGGAALVIGNGDYANAPDAVTAVRDAKSVADEFSEAGWQVSVGTDLDRAGMRRVFSEEKDLQHLPFEHGVVSGWLHRRGVMCPRETSQESCPPTAIVRSPITSKTRLRGDESESTASGEVAGQPCVGSVQPMHAERVALPATAV